MMTDDQIREFVKEETTSLGCGITVVFLVLVILLGVVLYDVKVIKKQLGQLQTQGEKR